MRVNTWGKNDIIYHILIDRFAGYKSKDRWDEPIFLGGNIKGIINKLPYLNELGVTTIWISPFYKTSAYHGYHITDFYEVDPHFGTKKDIHLLIKKTHELNMKIIADFVPNHCSKSHPYFIDAQKNKTSPYRKWFYFTDWPNTYQCFLSITDLPKLCLEEQSVSDHIIEAALYWLSFGFDGYRLDHVIGPSNHFWNKFVKRIKKQYPDTILIGEAWMQGIRFHELKTVKMNGKIWKWLRGNSSDTLLKTYTNILDGVLDFHIQQLIKDYICNKESSKISLMKNIHKHYGKYSSSDLLPTFLDNHDMDRFLFTCSNDISKLKKAARLQFSLDQPAIIYYGTEIGMGQKDSIWSRKSHGDILAREPMCWDKPNQDILDFYKEVIQEKRFSK